MRMELSGVELVPSEETRECPLLSSLSLFFSLSFSPSLPPSVSCEDTRRPMPVNLGEGFIKNPTMLSPQISSLQSCQKGRTVA